MPVERELAGLRPDREAMAKPAERHLADHLPWTAEREMGQGHARHLDPRDALPIRPAQPMVPGLDAPVRARQQRLRDGDLVLRGRLLGEAVGQAAPHVGRP